MSDVGAGVLAKRRVVPEDVITLSVFRLLILAVSYCSV